MAIAAVMMMSVAFAQDDNNKQQPPKMDPAEMAQKQTERMTQELGLSDAQATKVLELNKKYAGKMGPGMGGPGGPRGKRPQADNSTDGNTGATAQQGERPERPKMDESKMKEMKEQREAYNKELKGILSDDQYTKYQENSKKRGGRRGGPRGKKSEN